LDITQALYRHRGLRQKIGNQNSQLNFSLKFDAKESPA
jgi:hypothetical protein